MENPCLTFVTPALIAGDKSLASVIAHEISHSWTGNLVTNRDWRNFWLNEGFTMFLERKIIELQYGEDMALLSASVGYKGLLDDIAKFGEQNSYTSLYPNIQRVIF
jgi:leukotriene-A4 hydrolase